MTYCVVVDVQSCSGCCSPTPLQNQFQQIQATPALQILAVYGITFTSLSLAPVDLAWAEEVELACEKLEANNNLSRIVLDRKPARAIHSTMDLRRSKPHAQLRTIRTTTTTNCSSPTVCCYSSLR